jgi:hypothetical protein
MRMGHQDLNTHTMLSTNTLPTHHLHTLNNKLLPLTTNSKATHPLHPLTPLSQLLGELVLWPRQLENPLSLLDLTDMRLLILGIICTMNLLNPNTRIDMPPRRRLMIGKLVLMHLIMPDLKELEATLDQVYQILLPIQRWFIIIITTIIIIHPKDLRGYMVIPPPPPLLLLEIEI